MKQINILWIALLLSICGAVVVSCKGKKPATKPVKGVLEEAVKEGAAPNHVNDILDRHVLDGNYENILNDTVSKVSVWSLVRCDAGKSSDGFGVVVVKDGRATIFSNIRHGNRPFARYDAGKNELWFTGTSIEGTGTHVERFYKIRFTEDGPAQIAATIDPYEMQEALCKELEYATKGDKIRLFNGDRELTTVTNTVKDMGEFYDDVVWIGEQLSYDIGQDDLYVYVIPGVNFVTGKVLRYDDMPTISARVSLRDDGGFSLSDIGISIWPYVGDYLDEDNNESSLHINYRNDGKYDVQMDIFRLTSLSDGIGTMVDDGIAFTATDAAGNPIEGLISLKGETVTVTFTNSTWEPIQNGTSFKYIKKAN